IFTNKIMIEKSNKETLLSEENRYVDKNIDDFFHKFTNNENLTGRCYENIQENSIPPFSYAMHKYAKESSLVKFLDEKCKESNRKNKLFIYSLVFMASHFKTEHKCISVLKKINMSDALIKRITDHFLIMNNIDYCIYYFSK